MCTEPQHLTELLFGASPVSSRKRFASRWSWYNWWLPRLWNLRQSNFITTSLGWSYFYWFLLKLRIFWARLPARVPIGKRIVTIQTFHGQGKLAKSRDSHAECKIFGHNAAQKRSKILPTQLHPNMQNPSRKTWLKFKSKNPMSPLITPLLDFNYWEPAIVSSLASVHGTNCTWFYNMVSNLPTFA